MKSTWKNLTLFAVLTAAFLCGCSVQKPSTPITISSTPEENSAVSDIEPSAESSTASPAESSAELSAESSSESTQESSQETSDQSETEKLQAYYDSMHKEGRASLNNNMDLEYTWKVNQYKIADYNNDGSPELVIQYCCGIPQEYTFDNPQAEKQGFALEVVKCENGVIKSYRSHESFTNYVRFAGKELGNYEINDELYVDPDGKLGIYYTRATNYGLPFAASYQNYIISDGKIEHIIDLGVYMSTDNSETPDNTGSVYYGKTKDGHTNAYFFTSPNDEQRRMIDKDTALELFNKAHNIQLIEDFKIRSDRTGMTEVEQMEKNGYDIREVTF